MLLCTLAALALSGHQVPKFERDAYGTAIIHEASAGQAWRVAGYAVAEDRMWQMELSRRLARGRMAEILGKGYLQSDEEVVKTGYSDAELQQQIDHLSSEAREALEQYALGVNDFIAAGHLPAEYAQLGVKPAPWTPIDSAAIGVRLLQYFGRGGAGEIRNMAALNYLESREPIKGHLLDVLDDLLWFNDPSSPTTLAPEDDSRPHPSFTPPSRAVTEAHLKMLPRLSLLELLPGLSLASREKSTLLAEKIGAPFHTGSYCMVADAKRSGTGNAILLSGPQMGFTTPSIVHEISIQAPGLADVGMDLPGVPGVLVGHSRHLAWGITSGVADTDDIVFYPRSGDSGYLFGGAERTLETSVEAVQVKGDSDVTVSRARTVDGPVVLSTRPSGTKPGYLFARKSSYWMRELESYDAILSLGKASTAQEADAAAAKGTMSFNVFFAADNGDIGWRYAGLAPIRSEQLDARFPIPGDPKYEWKGMIPAEQMPHVINPKSGLLTNWNNKPASWFPNWDTPVWGRIFRVDAIRRNLAKPKLTAQDFELAAWTIARSDETWPFFAPYVEKALSEIRDDVSKHPERNDNTPSMVVQSIAGFDGRLMDGSRQAQAYRTFLGELRKVLFLPNVGNFIEPQLFEQAVQPSVILAALEHRTKFDYLKGRTVSEVVEKALNQAFTTLGYEDPGGPVRYKAPTINVPGEAPIPYSNRGTYIQIVEMLLSGPSGRNVVSPGDATEGAHSRDQVPLARAWTFKPMHRPW